MYFSIVMIQKNQFKTVIIFVKRIEIQGLFKLVQTKYHGISVNKEILRRGYKIHVVFDQSLNGFYSCRVALKVRQFCLEEVLKQVFRKLIDQVLCKKGRYKINVFL